MSYEDLSVLESIIHITAERDIKSLENVLLKALWEIDEFETLLLLRLPMDGAKTSMEIANSLPENGYLKKLKLMGQEGNDPLVEVDGLIGRCLSEKHPCLIQKDSVVRAVFPIITNKTVTAVLDVYSLQYDDKKEKLISFIVRIYANFLTVLHDNEHDTLTALLNRKTFDAKITEILLQPIACNQELYNQERRAQSAEAVHWIGILDNDHFKRVNDDFGHIYGDEVLILFADLMRKIFRSSDLLFRFGGEEFIVVLLNVTEPHAISVFERFRKGLEMTDFPQVSRVTVSTGMARVEADCHVTELLDRADKSLYFAKEHGRNQVCNYTGLIKTGKLKQKIINTDIEMF